MTEDNRCQFDQRCRTTAIEIATQTGLEGAVSINFMPNAVYEPRHCIGRTLWTADTFDFDITRLIFEFTLHDLASDTDHLKDIVTVDKEYGFRTAIDDFGAGHSGIRT